MLVCHVWRAKSRPVNCLRLAILPHHLLAQLLSPANNKIDYYRLTPM